MASVPKDRWYCMVLCMFLPALKVSVQQRGEPITVGLQEGMLLGCRCPWNGNLSLVTWTKSPHTNTPIAVLHPDLGTNFHWRYRQRVEFPRAAPLDGSMVLRNVTHQDLGLFHCTITTFPRGSWSQDVVVEDRDEPSGEDDPVDAMMDASGLTPDLQMNVTVGDRVTLPCSRGDDSIHDNGTATVWRVSVERLLQDRRDHPWSLVASLEATGEEGEEKEEGEEEEEGEEAGGGRARVTCAGSLGCILRLDGVTEEDGGLYRCRFFSEVGLSRTVLLNVRHSGPTDKFRISDYMTYIYIGCGAAGFLILLSLILVLLSRYRKKSQREGGRVKGQSPPTNHGPSNADIPLPNQQGSLTRRNNYEDYRGRSRPCERGGDTVYVNMRYGGAQRSQRPAC